MPEQSYRVLKISQLDEARIEVIGEFENEEDARQYANDAQFKDSSNQSEYVVKTIKPNPVVP